MDVFKYISEILKQFTTAQRILALLMLLTSIIMISLGPKMIDAVSVDNTEYKDKVDRQTREIRVLQVTVDSLDSKIRASQRQCTNEITRREEEFIAMLDELKGEMNKSVSKTRTPIRRSLATSNESYRNYEIIGQDTVYVARSAAPASVETQQTSNDSKVDIKTVCKKIESMKARIKN